MKNSQPDLQYSKKVIENALRNAASFALELDGKEEIISFFDYEGNLTDLGEACSEEPEWIKSWVNRLFKEQTRILSLQEVIARGDFL